MGNFLSANAGPSLGKDDVKRVERSEDDDIRDERSVDDDEREERLEDGDGGKEEARSDDDQRLEDGDGGKEEARSDDDHDMREQAAPHFLSEEAALRRRQSAQTANMTEWTQLGEFCESGGPALRIADDRLKVSGTDFCATLSDRPLELGSGSYTFHFEFHSGHFMIGCFDAKVRNSISGANYSSIQGEAAWCLENVRKQRNIFLNGKVHSLYSPHGERSLDPNNERPKGAELNGELCRASFDLLGGIITVRCLDRETREPKGDSEPWVVDGIEPEPFEDGIARIWPVVCVFGHGDCISFPASAETGILTKSARKR